MYIPYQLKVIRKWKRHNLVKNKTGKVDWKALILNRGLLAKLGLFIEIIKIYLVDEWYNVREVLRDGYDKG